MTPLRILSALSLASALIGCGGQYDIDPTVSLATATVVSSSANQSAAPAVSAPVVSNVASGNMPVPDCAPEGCAGLRIIDGNAEAWRIDAARRAERDAGQS